MAQGLFVTGTDTGVGKTLVTCAIIRSLLSGGVPVFAAKPLATGSEPRPDGSLAHPDVAHLRDALGGKPVWVGYESPHAAAPSMAARWEGKSLSVPEIAKNLLSAIPEGHFAVIEGAGGLLCPVGRDQTMAELAQILDFPVVVVARAALGTLNHTLLTLEAAKNRGLRVAGIILNETSPPDQPKNRVEDETEVELSLLTDTHVLKRVAFGDLSGKSLFSLPWFDLASSEFIHRRA